ncbi:uncharacterized protein N7503_010923 [Penicillium pulvis]|uniref:uncharacterized protein n=1 Tax=Penicillium pulvis TaxID=1562058 RepID=UPI00254786B7|nr:uncharacterized protein N7503_010923 [Penicillium pulvis]KAJ5785711.1 hypothetical protein N7503_010923 [Penicillium pulvis]
MTVTSRGTQYDRLALMYLGDAEVFRTSTAEPTSTGIVWTYIKEMSQYNALWQEPQKLIFDLGNIITDVYTGPYNVTLTAHFSYENNARTADIILPLSTRKSSSNSSSSFTVPTDNTTVSYKIPAAASRAVVSISACGQSEEEFWWSNVFTEDSEDFEDTAGEFYGFSPFREIQLYIDGILAGVVWPFPIIFTGGVAPGFWHPVVGIDAFDLRQPEIDISPFLPLVQDGQEHAFEIRVTGLNVSSGGVATLANTVNSYWVVTGNIFLYTDDKNTSALATGDTTAPYVESPEPKFTITRNLVENESLSYSVVAERTFKSTSSKFAWSQTLSYYNYGYVNQAGFGQVNRQLTSGKNNIAKLGENSSSNETTFNYPLLVNATYTLTDTSETIDSWMKRGLEIESTGGPGISTYTMASGPSRLYTTQSGKAYYGAFSGESTTSTGSTLDEYQSTANGVEYSRTVRAIGGNVVYDSQPSSGEKSSFQSHNAGPLGRGSVRNPAPRSLLAAFEQTDILDYEEHPAKRRKVSKYTVANLAQTLGLSSNGTPLGYIPLARLALRMVSVRVTTVPEQVANSLPLLLQIFTGDSQSNIDDFQSSIDPSRRLPVLLGVIPIHSIDGNSLSATDQTSVNHASYTLELRTVGSEKIEGEGIIQHTFDESRLRSLFQQLNLASRLSSADRYSNGPPTACYQATLSRSDRNLFCLEVNILWKDSLDIPDLMHLRDPILHVFGKYALQEAFDPPEGVSTKRLLREKLLGSSQTWSPRRFYDSVHVPPQTERTSADIKCPDLVCELFPFQRRAVRWLLQREGMELQSDGSPTPISKPSTGGLPASFQQMKDADGRICFFSHLFMIITTDLSAWGDDAADNIKGGILAEEMGLGKTVEMIALVSLNRRPIQLKLDPDGLRASGATLIITPPAILEQWKQEFQQHAPELRVHHYTGIKRGQEGSDDLIIEELSEFDVVLTTYNVISREVHYTNTAPKRSLRHKKRFEARQTPLVRISWWRVCLDEAQMIESGVSNAAKVARLIPRVNAWAVTGTPLRRNIDDLFGLLLFLRYYPFCHSNPLWTRLYSKFGSVLVHIIQKIALRHTKDCVRDELRLPQQKRIVITTPFTAIEEQHYGQLFEEMCEQCGLDATGAPLSSDWNPEDPGIIERMRSWLTRLRQTCLHPEVSGSNRRALGAGSGPLRTVDEVLEVMIENTDTSIRAEERALLLSQLRRGQFLENAKRRKEALSIWQAALEHSTKLVEEGRAQLSLQKELLKDAIKDGSKDPSEEISDDENEEADKNSRIGQCRLRLRAALEVQHIAVFFTANAYFQIKSDTSLTQPESDEFKMLEKKEEEGYEAAKIIRKEMLTDISQKVERYMKMIKEKTQKKQFVQIPKMKPHLYNRGLESYRLLNNFEDLCTSLNKHAEQYIEWREVMINLVSQSLIDQEEDAELEGNEYERSTKHQDEMYVYMEALRTAYADRHDALTGQKNILISHEVKAGIIQAQKDEGPSPKLFLSIMNTRSEIMPDSQLGSLRGIISELRSLVTSLDWQATGGSSRARAELELVVEVLKNAGQMIAEQLKVSASLEREVEMFRDTMNNRLEYYRHLQQISDTVAPYDEENAGKPMNEDLFASKLKQEEKLESKISSLKSKRRYLIHLRDESGSEDSSRICIICQSSFEVGVLTVCGHKYCTDCLRLWWRQHRTCPMCKRPLKYNDFHQITYKPQELVAQEEESAIKFDHERHSKNAIYSDISSGLLNEIKNIDLNGSFGTKIDTLARHIIWLREYDPGAKSIIFSQYKNFLEVLQRALHRFKIVSSSVDYPGGIESFKKDPAVECFLLHGKAQSSGLTLINATHVFLCEPLINTAIELQAIARVHRIGQHRPTTVWMYLVSGTVEESIYELSVARRLAHIIEKEKQEKNARSTFPEDFDESLINDLTETAIDSANSMEIQDAGLTNLMTSGASGGELVKKDDLWQCLFGNAVSKEDDNDRSAEAEREVSRFLRGEAAYQRRDEAHL